MTRNQEMRQLYQSGCRVIDLAVQFDITVARVYQIFREPDLTITVSCKHKDYDGIKRGPKPKSRAHLVITAELDLVSEDDAEDWRDRLQRIVKREIDALHRPVVRAAVVAG